VLALAGGLLGLLLGNFGIEALRQLGTERLPLGGTIQFDARVAAVSLVVALLVGVLLALPIIWFNVRAKLAPNLQTETRTGTTGRAAQQMRHVFIVVQVMLAFGLLASSGLFGLSLKRLLDTPTGFNAANVLTSRLVLPWKTYPDDEKRRAFVARLLPSLRELPGVTHVALTTYLPFSGQGSNTAIMVEGYVPKPGDTVRAHYISVASADYWPLMGIPLRAGRLFEDADNEREQRVCIVDQAFADRYWPGVDPVGRRLAVGPEFNEQEATTVVGVVANIKQNQLSDPDGYGAVYLPFRAWNPNGFALLVRTSLPPESLGPTLQKAILQLDPELPVDDLRTMEMRIDDTLLVRRSLAILGAVFAGVALTLAAIGTYGVLAYAVSQRRREIGVRMALGAMPGQILAQFLRLGLILLGVGLALGTVFAWIAGRLMQSQLFGVGAIHAGVIAVSAAVMVVVVLLATLLPSRRAARVNPIDALRDE